MVHFNCHGRVPRWFDGFGKLGAPITVPGWSNFQMIDQETNILLTGVPDEILRHPERGLWIGDYKTARYTDTQDELASMYEVQLNCYAHISQKIGLGSVYGLGLLYYEPITEVEANDADFLIKKDRLFLGFSPKLKPVKLEPSILPPLLQQVREICDLHDSPPGRLGCRDCFRLDTLLREAGRAFSSSKVRPQL